MRGQLGSRRPSRREALDNQPSSAIPDPTERRRCSTTAKKSLPSVSHLHQSTSAKPAHPNTCAVGTDWITHKREKALTWLWPAVRPRCPLNTSNHTRMITLETGQTHQGEDTQHCGRTPVNSQQATKTLPSRASAHKAQPATSTPAQPRFWEQGVFQQYQYLPEENPKTQSALLLHVFVVVAVALAVAVVVAVAVAVVVDDVVVAVFHNCVCVNIRWWSIVQGPTSDWTEPEKATNVAKNPGAESPERKTSGDSSTPEPSTTNNRWPPRAPENPLKAGTQRPKGRSPKKAAKRGEKRPLSPFRPPELGHELSLTHLATREHVAA